MSGQIILNSVGSYLEGDFIGPLGQNGLPLLGEATVHILDRCPEWDANLSDEDAKAINDRLDEDTDQILALMGYKHPHLYSNTFRSLDEKEKDSDS